MATATEDQERASESWKDERRSPGDIQSADLGLLILLVYPA